MRSHRELWKRVQGALTGEALGRTVAELVLAEVDRMDMGHPPLWSDAELTALKVPIVRDRRARHAYVRAITEGCKALGIEPPSLETLDPPDEVSLEGMIRFHVIDRFMGWEKPRLDALESYVEPGSWINWRQHPWTPSGIERVSADPEEAWADFVVWCKDGPCQSAEPLMRKETYLRVFTQNKPYHPWQLRAPEDPELRPAAHP